MQVGITAVAGVWALAAMRRAALAGRALWATVAVSFGVVALNVVAASVLAARYDWPFPPLHLPYEFSGLVAIAIVYSYGKQMPTRRLAIYGGGCLFLMGLALRALFMS